MLLGKAKSGFQARQQLRWEWRALGALGFRRRSMHTPEHQALDDHLADQLSPTRPLRVKPHFRLKLVTQPGIDPKPEHPTPNIRRARLALSLKPPNSGRWRPWTDWHRDRFQYSDMTICRRATAQLQASQSKLAVENAGGCGSDVLRYAHVRLVPLAAAVALLLVL